MGNIAKRISDARYLFCSSSSSSLRYPPNVRAKVLIYYEGSTSFHVVESISSSSSIPSLGHSLKGFIFPMTLTKKIIPQNEEIIIRYDWEVTL